jgi:general secretion pathway protein K
MKSLAGFSQQRGVAAVVAILIVALAASAASYLISRYSLAFRHVENVGSRAQADAIARAAVYWAADILQKDRDRGIDHQGEAWAQILPPIPAEDATLVGRIVDEQGKFNLNTLVRCTNPQERCIENQNAVVVLERLLRIADVQGDAGALVDAVIDWIDNDHEVRQPGGAERTHYLGLDPPYLAANMRLTDVGELLRVKGFTEEIVRKISPFVTALPRETTINIYTAPEQVLLALAPGISGSDMRALLEERLNDQKRLQGQEKKFRAEFEKRLGSDEAKKNVAGLYDVKSDYFSVTGAVQRGRVVAGYRALLQRPQNGPVAIVALTEDPL